MTKRGIQLVMVDELYILTCLSFCMDHNGHYVLASLWTAQLVCFGQHLNSCCRHYFRPHVYPTSARLDRCTHYYIWYLYTLYVLTLFCCRNYRMAGLDTHHVTMLDCCGWKQGWESSGLTAMKGDAQTVICPGRAQFQCTAPPISQPRLGEVLKSWNMAPIKGPGLWIGWDSSESRGLSLVVSWRGRED